MSSLYRRLFRYRATELRTPLEDYLTECLADIFNRLDLKRKNDFAKSHFVPQILQDRWGASESGALRMHTQHHIDIGRIDMVLFDGVTPLVAIENKVSAPVGAGENEKSHQLAIYGRWIKRKNEEFPIICLLTHSTPAPLGFSEHGVGSGGAVPHVVSWSSIAAQLATMSRDSELPIDVRTLSRELFAFLEENGMSGEFAGRDELAAAIIYLKAGSRMEYTFATIYEHLKTLGGAFNPNESIYEQALEFRTKDRVIWGYKVINHSTLRDVYFGYGIALDPKLTFRGEDTPNHDSIFLCLLAENRRSMQALRAAKDKPEKPWTYVEFDDWSTIISFRPLSPFFSEPETLAHKMIEWIDEEAGDISSFVSELS
ncbi:MAG: hypothetical protein AB1586_00400 [Pseudomonadota bacterium]